MAGLGLTPVTLPVHGNPAPRLRVETTAVDETRELLDLVPADPALSSWVRGGEGLVGWGVAARIDTGGAQRFAAAQQWWREVTAAAEVTDEVGLPGSGPVAFGSFAYADESSSGATLLVPRVVIGRRDGVTWRTVTTVLDAASPGAAVAGASDSPADVSAPASPGAVRVEPGSLTDTRWRDAVGEAVERIRSGRLDKVVLARDVTARAERPIDARHLLGRLARDYDRTWLFSVDGLVGATPEMLVRLEKGLVTSRVLAGTIRRTGDDEHDLALAASLARSSKDLEEHEYAVTSVAEALAPHCTSRSIPESPFVLHLPNVMHLATDVTGRTRNGATSLDLAAALHPSAAVCGTPRAQAQELISELEHLDRGRYAGPVGWMDASGDGEWGIALRCGAIDPADARTMRLFAGCGIVAGSRPEDELAESEAKLLPMRFALGSD